MLWVVHDTLGFSLLYSSYKGPGQCLQLFLFVPAFDEISVTCSLQAKKRPGEHCLTLGAVMLRRSPPLPAFALVAPTQQLPALRLSQLLQIRSYGRQRNARSSY